MIAMRARATRWFPLLVLAGCIADDTRTNEVTRAELERLLSAAKGERERARLRLRILEREVREADAAGQEARERLAHARAARDRQAEALARELALLQRIEEDLVIARARQAQLRGADSRPQSSAESRASQPR